MVEVDELKERLVKIRESVVLYVPMQDDNGRIITMKKVKKMEKTYLNDITALKESIYTYIFAALVVLSGLWGKVEIGTIIGLLISLAVMLLGGWFKKINELKLLTETQKVKALEQENIDLKTKVSEYTCTIERLTLKKE